MKAQFAVVAGLLLLLGGITYTNAHNASVAGIHTAVPIVSATHTPSPTASPTPTVLPTPTVAYRSPTAQPSPQAKASSDGLGNGNYYTNVDGNQVHSPAFSTDGSVPAGATAQCTDGTYSFSQHRRGTCSHHGGVRTWY